jgi:uncharacterized membrane protein HdeD (DUF308 family)
VNNIYKINKVKEVKMVKAMEKMRISGMTAAILMILFGIAIIAFPKLLVWLVGGYFIVRGILELILIPR